MKRNYKYINISKISKIGILSINTPGANLLSIEVFKELEEALDDFALDEFIKVILLKAETKVSQKGTKIFSAGINLKDYDNKFKLLEEDPEKFKCLLKNSRNLMEKIENLEKPVIAGIEGMAVGGAFELVLACDAILASSSASFVLSEINIGLIPGYGGIHRLLRVLGKNRTFNIIANGKLLTAEELFEAGIVTEIYSDESFSENVIDYCNNLVQKSPNALSLVKKTIIDISKKLLVDEIEIENFVRAASHNDAKEGINAFLEKRKPKV